MRTSVTLLDTLLSLLKTEIRDSKDLRIIYPNTLNNYKQDLLTERYGQDFELLSHNPNSPEHLQFVGETPTYSTPVFVNKIYSQSDLKIGLGTIRANVFIGATGGRTSVIPSVAGSKSIERSAKILATHPLSPYSTDTPICQDLDEASRLAGLDFIINAVPDCDDHVAHIAAGDPYSSWGNSIQYVWNVTKVPIRHKADISVISAGGSDYDTTFFDALDCLYPAYEATEQGGIILLIAECPDGVGPSGFLKGVSECSSESEVTFLSHTRYELGMEKARLLLRVLASRRVIICSRLRESLVSERLRCQSVRDPQEGLALAKSLIVSSPKIALISQGMKTIPVMSS